MSAVAMPNATDARRMKGEWLRRRSGLRPASEDCPVVGDANKLCSRCRAELGWVVNRGAVCQACRLRVCKACREYTVRTVDWVCTVCYKRSQVQTATGEWMNEFAKKSGQWRENKFYMSAADIIKSTIRRSWTICDPNPRWPTTRDSPEFRPYNSLPRGRDVTDFLSLQLQQSDASELQQQQEQDATKTDDPVETCRNVDKSLPRQRRISQFERTLSELYGSQKKSSSARRTSEDTSTSSDKLEKALSPNGVEKKNAEFKPSKIPSPRKKMQYARSSETSSTTVTETSKQILRKHSSLQLVKRHSSKSCDDTSVTIREEKHVYFDDECKNVTPKSGIPKRETKSNRNSKSESKSSEDSEIEPIINENCIDLSSESKRELAPSDDKDACEFPGTVFRKVAIKKRRNDFRKSQAFDEGSVTRRKHRYSETSRDDILDPETGRILLPEGDDYKLVFISSDSSSKEEDLDDNDSLSSATTAHSFTIDDCDWDYFEPSTGVRPVLCWSNRNNSPFGSPRVYRRAVLDSPLGSPLVYRRALESDTGTGTDEDVTVGSPASSDVLSRSSETEDHLSMDEQQQLLQCVLHDVTGGIQSSVTAASTPSMSARPPSCQSCGAITPATQFVPIPVLVPIPVPVAAFWNPLDPVILYNTSDTLDGNLRARLRAIQQRTGAFLLPYVNQASLISSLISAGGDSNTLLSFQQQQQQYSMCTTSVAANVSKTETSMPAAFDRNTVRPDEQEAGERVHEPETNEPGSNADTKPRVTPNGEDQQQFKFPLITAFSDSDVIRAGYLQSENTFMSSTESSDSSGVSEDEGVGKPRIQRTYNVSGNDNKRDSDDDLLSCSSNVTSDDEDDDEVSRMSNSSDRHESSSSSSTPADTDTDDTGTVADSKPKKFSKVFVVNNINDSSSDIEDNITDSSTDSSDNDTDTEQDCVVLNYIRPIVDATDNPINNTIQNDSVVLLKHVISAEVDANKYSNRLESINEVREPDVNNGNIVLLKHVTFDLTQNKIDSDSSEHDMNNDCDSDSEINLISYKIVNDCDIDTLDKNMISTIERETYHIDNNNILETESAVAVEHLIQSTDQFTKIAAGTLDLTDDSDQQSRRNLNLISDTPTINFNGSEESKQIAIDLETRLEFNVKASEQSVTADISVNPALLETINEIDNTPPVTVTDKNYFSSSRHLIDVKLLPENCSLLDFTKIGESASIALSSIDIIHSNNNKSVFPKEEKFETIDNKQSEVSTSEQLSASVSEWNTSARIRSDDPVSLPRRGQCAVRGDGLLRGARTGAPTAVDYELSAHHVPLPTARYTSLVMITQEPPRTNTTTADVFGPQVSIVPSDTTIVVPITNDSVVVRHTNWQNETILINDANTEGGTSGTEHNSEPSGLAGYFALALDNPQDDNIRQPRRKPLVTTTPSKNETVTVVASSDNNDGVTVVTGSETLSAVVCLEEGLADDDSWVEDISHDEDEFATTTATDSSSGEEVTVSSSMDQEEELRGYHRSAIDFTLHTIVEESCEESEVEHSHTNNKKTRPASATDLEKYFFYRLGDGTVPNASLNREDALSETSSIYSEGMDSLGAAEDMPNDGNQQDPAELASSRLEKYFLSGFMGFTAERRDSDGSVGSDSEGRPSPEQRRKRLVRARGTGRSHSSSLDNLLANAELSGNELQSVDTQLGSENSSSSETDTYDEPSSNFEKSDGQFDTVKRKKCKKQRVVSGGSISPHEEKKLETMEESYEIKDSDGDDDGNKTPQPEFLLPISVDLVNSRKHQSRDSGFIGSCDDLLKDQRSHTDYNGCSDSSPSSTKTLELKNDLEKITEEKRTIDDKVEKYYSGPPATTLTRKDSFNNWSSDEETNLMMSKMRQFFKTMVATSSNAQLNTPSKQTTTPLLEKQNAPEPVPSPRRNKPPQLVYFENELTRLMKTVPGIRDDQVREIVEYLSSEDTWSDSYDSSDYTSSDLECTVVAQKSALQEQISASCQQIINKFDKNAEDEEGDEGDGGIIDDSQGLNRETAFVYQKLVASFNKITSVNDNISDATPSNNSPPLIAKVMHHIGSRLVALMHEVSSGESHCSTSPKVRYHHRRLQQKLSSASTTTTEDDDSTSDSNLPDRLTGLDTSYNLLPRSRSHDLLLGDARAHHQSSSGVSDIAEEREASDYERFSWRGSFESALMATDSRTKLSLLGTEGSASASAMAAKRRSAGDLLFNPKSLSREQLDRVRSCGSIGGGSNSEEKHWVVTPAVRPNRRRSSVPDASCGSGGSADGEDDDEEDIENRSTLPRSLQTNTATTNSLPRLPTTSSTAANMHKAQSMHHFLQHNVKSARYRPPGFNRTTIVTAGVSLGPKRAVSAPGLQLAHPRRDVRRRSQQPSLADDVSVAESNSSPIVGLRSGSKSSSPSPIHGSTLTRGTGSVSSADWQNNEDDIDRLVAIHQTRSSLSSLGLRSDSMASVYSGAGEGRYGIVAVRGQVEFGLQYNYKAGALEVHVKQCRDLAAVDAKRNRSDPYVKVYLLPDKSKGGKRKTKVKKHTLNPVFDECLKFHLTLNGLETRTLWLTVWHSDMFGRNDFLGEVMMPLENKVFDEPAPKWYNLQERTEPFEELASYKGDIIVGLKFVPPDMTVQKKGKRSRGALHVLVKEAKCLTAVKANGTSDPFCKSYLLPDKGRSNKQKTPILRRQTSPVWNHTFVYDDVTLQELAERALELTVWDHDRLASNEFLGGVRFSLGTSKHYGKNVDWMDATGKECSLWQSMLERPNFWVEGCVTLRPSLDYRCS